MTLREKLNGRRHRAALCVFVVVVLGHWAEHLAQAVRIYVLGQPVFGEPLWSLGGLPLSSVYPLQH